MDSNAPSVHPQQALAVYAEPWVAGARVAVFGDASLGLGARLTELGARAVEVWDPDPARAARAQADEASRGATTHVYTNSEVDVRGADLVLVTDLGLFSDPAALVRRARRAVGADGLAMIAAKSAEVVSPRGPRAFDYYDLFDIVASEFESVRMVAQLPFHGIALVELGDEDESPSVSVDTQLADSGRVPEAFVVVASQRRTELEPYAIVQLPPPTPVEEVPIDREALARSELRGELLSSQLDDLRTRLSDDARATEQVAALEEALALRSAQVVELERALSARGRELADLSNQVEEMRAAAEAGGIAAAQVGEVALRADRAERRVALLEMELAAVAQEATRAIEGHAAELASIEEGLRERAHAIRALEGELARRDQMVRDLLGTLDELQAEPPPPVAPVAEPPVAAVPGGLADENVRLRAQLDALALDLARREGDAQATGWRIAELERQLAEGAEHVVTPPDSGHQLAAALDEVDALRTALAQEHEMRARAESGEELARARAEIERQAVLMEQLSRELGARPLSGLDRGERGVGDAAGPRTGPREDSR